MKIKLSSSAFLDGEPIPKPHTGDGVDISPPLAWEEVPSGTQELALICEDPDAPTKEPWVHWVLYKIPAGVRRLEPGMPNQARLNEPAGALQGRNSWSSGQTIGYRGPAPPPGHGVHHYHFRLFALDAPLALDESVDVRELRRAMSGHILGEGLLIGTYQR